MRYLQKDLGNAQVAVSHGNRYNTYPSTPLENTRSPNILLSDNTGSMGTADEFYNPLLASLLVNQFYWGHKYLPPDPDS